jgi:hypothetical protein
MTFRGHALSLLSGTIDTVIVVDKTSPQERSPTFLVTRVFDD